MSVEGGAEKTLGSLEQERRPTIPLSPALRLSQAPDGKSLTYGTGFYESGC